MRGWHDLPPAPEGPLRMSRVVVIGATGNIGSYLVPRLVRGGDEVIAMSRGVRGLYHASPQWKSVTRVRVDREAQDAEGTFGAQVAALRPDVVIDLVCFTAASAQQLVDALRPRRPLLAHCGTIWVHGPALRVPVTEDEPRTAYGEYGTGKAEIEALLHQETRAGGGPAGGPPPGHTRRPRPPGIPPPGRTRPPPCPPAARGPVRARVRSRCTPHSTPCTTPCPGSSPTARPTSAASRGESDEGAANGGRALLRPAGLRLRAALRGRRRPAAGLR